MCLRDDDWRLSEPLRHLTKRFLPQTLARQCGPRSRGPGGSWVVPFRLGGVFRRLRRAAAAAEASTRFRSANWTTVRSGNSLSRVGRKRHVSEAPTIRPNGPSSNFCEARFLGIYPMRGRRAILARNLRRPPDRRRSKRRCTRVRRADQEVERLWPTSGFPDYPGVERLRLTLWGFRELSAAGRVRVAL
jgi:hypothetical protein